MLSECKFCLQRITLHYSYVYKHCCKWEYILNHILKSELHY